MTSRHQATYERAVRLHNRAAKCQAAGEPFRPEKLYLRSLELKERLFGPDHLEIALTLNNLALYYKSLGYLADARKAYLRALAIFQQVYGGCHPSVADVLFNLAQLLKIESEAMEERSQAIQEATAELDSPPPKIRAELANFALFIGPSRIHRFGVFADEPIPAGTRIIQYTGERVGRRLWAERQRHRTYLLRFDKYWAIDGSVGGSGAELINHCCEPNCRFERDGGRRWVSSVKPIEKGQELLLDYRFRKARQVVPCYCGAASCRGSMNVR